MNFIEGLKFGAAFYIGYNVVKGIDYALSRRGVYRKIGCKIRKVEEKPKKKSKRIIGFKMDPNEEGAV